jgi:hypothetical protein
LVFRKGETAHSRPRQLWTISEHVQRKEAFPLTAEIGQAFLVFSRCATFHCNEFRRLAAEFAALKGGLGCRETIAKAFGPPGFSATIAGAWF